MGEWQIVYILGAADNSYVQHLAVAFVSLLLNLGPGWKAKFFVADGELTAENRLRLSQSVRRHGGEIEFLAVDKTNFDDLFIASGRHITQASYYRLVMPDMLREEPIGKLIYLDCDLIVRDDVCKLLEVGLGWHPIGAVEDLGGGNRLADLYIPEGSAYFNSGVLLINVPVWRETEVASKVFRFLRENRHRLHYHDQDGLNAVLHGQWVHLDPKWNVQRNMLGRFETSPDKEKRFKQAASQPSIVHFTGKSKPWHYDSNHPYKKEYYRYLSYTEWSHYKPKAGLRLLAKKLARVLLPGPVLTAIRRLTFR